MYIFISQTICSLHALKKICNITNSLDTSVMGTVERRRHECDGSVPFSLPEPSHMHESSMVALFDLNGIKPLRVYLCLFISRIPIG